MKYLVINRTLLFVSLLVLCAALALSFSPVNAQSAHCEINGQEGVKVSIPIDGQDCVPVGEAGNLENNIIFRFLVVFINFLAAGVGLAVVGGIIYGGYMYTTARANAAQVEKGKTIIVNSIIGLLLFIFMYAILNFIIPGAIF